MRKQLLIVLILAVFAFATGFAPVVQAQDRVSVVGTIELEDGVPILVVPGGQIYDLEGADLSELSGKQVEVTGTLIESEGAPLIQMEGYRRVQ